MKMKLSKGFTIVELLVVVSIIALLIGILLPAIGKARDKARTSNSISNLRQLATAHNAYAGDWEDSQISLNRYNISQYGNMARGYASRRASGTLIRDGMHLKDRDRTAAKILAALVFGVTGGAIWAPPT